MDKVKIELTHAINIDGTIIGRGFNDKVSLCFHLNLQLIRCPVHHAQRPTDRCRQWCEPYWEYQFEKLECEFTLTRFDKQVLKLFGLAPGQLTPLTIRGAVISDNGNQTSVVINLQGIIREMDPGNWKPGEKATLKIVMVSFSLTSSAMRSAAALSGVTNPPFRNGRA
jgi:hypothetical protein